MGANIDTQSETFRKMTCQLLGAENPTCVSFSFGNYWFDNAEDESFDKALLEIDALKWQ